jgi:protease-4
MPSLLITPVADTRELQQITVERGHGWSPKKIAMIEVEGMLMNMRTGGFLQPSENKLSLFTQQLELAEKDPDVKAVLLRINSPGGTVTTSDTMYQALVDFRKRSGKPVVASTQDLVASGGYYVACGADHIVAHPTSVIGSIGVIFETFDAEDGLAKLGIRTEAIKSAPLKDLGSPFRHRTDAEREVLQAMVDQYYARFKNVVAERRHITDPDRMNLVSDGRVFTGIDAVRLGLADSNGTLPDALALTRKLANQPDARVIMYKRPHGYTGSIYATANTPEPQASSPTNTINVNLPLSNLPTGFYYLWRP